jgi:Family of unknown function (DUF6169)
MQQYEFDFIEDEATDYFFKTQFNVFYRVEFKPTGYIFGDDYVWSHHCYEFSIKISEKSPQNPPTDSLIPTTIAAIFLHFFEDKEKIILYTCDTSDRKHLARVRKFDRWFEQFNQNDNFIKLNHSIYDNTLQTTYYNSLIIKNNNSFRAEITEAFDELIGGFEEDK